MSHSDEIINTIANMLAQDTEYQLDGTLLFARVKPGMVGPSIFKDRGNHIVFRIPSQDLMHVLLDLWEEAEPHKRWAEIEYVVRDGKFHVGFTYPNDIDPNEDEDDRRDRIVRRHFGDKPIVYPPLPEGNGVFEL